jgi:cysteine desulfurase / selenocysteine lyase
MLAALAPPEHFPSLDGQAFFDTATDGPLPEPVREAAEAFWRDSTPGRPNHYATRLSAYDGARSAAARLLNAPERDVAITQSATEAMCQLAWSIRPRAGDNVVTIDVDFPTVTYPWMRIREETGAEVRFVRALDDPGALSVDAIEELVDERTAVVAVSHVQYTTGHRLDLSELARLAHSHGALLLVDAAQSLGAVPVDAPASGVDALVGTAGKWLCAEYGSGICYLNPRLRDSLAPPFVGWRSAAGANHGVTRIDAVSLPAPAGADALELSSTSYLSRFALGACIDYLMGYGIDAIRRHGVRLSALLMDGLADLGAELVTPRDDARRGGIVAARFPGRDSDALADELVRAGVIVTSRQGCIRFAIHLYNGEDDVRRALAVLESTNKSG